MFGSENIYLDFFENIKSEPESLLKRVCSFLNVSDTFDFNLREINNKVAKTDYDIKMPNELYSVLKKLYIYKIQEQSQFFGSYCTQWWEKL